jgi:hypothetical protein
MPSRMLGRRQDRGGEAERAIENDLLVDRAAPAAAALASKEPGWPSAEGRGRSA